MHRQTALVLCSLLALACGPSPGGTSDSDATSTQAAGTTDVVTTTSTAGSSSAGTTGTTTDTTAGTTAGTTAETTAGPPTTGDTGGPTDDPTGAPLCEEIVGSEDCALLVEVSPDLTLEQCLECQGAPCGQNDACDSQYPCVDGTIVLRGCCTDDQCAGLTPFCGMFIGTNNVCVLNDDV